MIAYDISPEEYRHWTLKVDPPVATLTLDGDEEAGDDLASLLRVDIELSDALQRLRFEYPDVSVVVLTGATNHAFSTEIAEIPPGAAPDVAAIVRTFRSEVRCAIEDARTNTGMVFGDRARAGAGPSPRGLASEAVQLGPLLREEFEGGFAYPNVRVDVDRQASVATLTIVGPADHECFAPEPGPRRLRSRWWPMAVCRELDDALLLLRTCRPEVRLLVLRTEGDPLAVASADVALTTGYEHDWFVREVVLFWKRTLRRVDGAWQSVIALVEPGSCFVGTLLELALAADRISIADGEAEILLTGMNFGPLPRASGLTRLESRFLNRSDHVAALAERVGEPITAAEAAELGLLAPPPPAVSAP